MPRIVMLIEMIVFGSRWLLVPFLFGLIAGLAGLLVRFVIKLVEVVTHLPAYEPSDAIVDLLKLVDLALTANLIVIIVCSSYENFVAPIDYDQRKNWPPGLVRIGFSGLKQKLLGSIAVIAAVNVLEWFMDVDRAADSIKLAWVVGILIAFAFAMVLLAVADRLANSGDQPH